MDEIIALAQVQAGVIARWQLRTFGVGDGAIRGLLSHHGWQRIHPGIYLLPGSRFGHQQRVWAGVLVYADPQLSLSAATAGLSSGAGPRNACVRAVKDARVVVTGRAGAALHGLLPETKAIDLAVPQLKHRVSRPGLQVRRLRPYGPEELRRIQGLTVASPVRTIVDAALFLPASKAAVRQLQAMIIAADRLWQASPREFAAYLEAHQNFKGRPRLERAVRPLTTKLSHSGVEGRARQLASKVASSLGLKVEPRPYDIVHDGVTIAQADIAVVSLKYDAEIDGPHHNLREWIVKDKTRDRLVRRIAWHVERYPTDLVEDDEPQYCRRIHEDLVMLLERRRNAA